MYFEILFKLQFRFREGSVRVGVGDNNERKSRQSVKQIIGKAIRSNAVFGNVEMVATSIPEQTKKFKTIYVLNRQINYIKFIKLKTRGF